MKTIQIRPGLWLIQVQKPAFRGFLNMIYAGEGISSNAWLLDTGDGFLSLGSVQEEDRESWIREIRLTAGENLRWAVLFGTDQDRTCAEELLKEYPGCTILGSKNGLFQIHACMGRDFSSIEIRNNRDFSLGGKSFFFQVIQEKFPIPCIYAVDRTDRILFTADAFGSIGVCDEEAVSKMGQKEKWLEGVNLYCREISAADRVESMEKVSDLVRVQEISMICPSCGPAVDGQIDQLLSVYEPEKEKTAGKTGLAVVYRQEGYLPEIAGLIKAGAEASGITDVKLVDLSVVNRMQALEVISGAAACLFGTQARNGDVSKAVWDIVTSLKQKDCKGKPAAVFTSFTVEGSAAENLRQRLVLMGYDLTQKDLLIQGTPDKQMLDNIFEYGYGMGCFLQKIPNPHRPTLVKCLVCGEVFEASLGVCPVCGVGLEQCIPVEADDTAYRRDTRSTYLILGGGIAAVSAAEAIRLRDKTGKILVLSAEDYLPINRPMLTKDLKQTAEEPDSIQIHSQEWYDERGIELRLGIKAVALEPDSRSVVGSDGTRYHYDKLICATGAECFVPPFPGYDKNGVITIRHLGDVQNLQNRLKNGAKQVVVIGGGVLGLEAANELMRAGVKVTVLEAAPQIIGRQIDAQSADVIKKKMEGLGTVCYEGVSIAGIDGGTDVSGVSLADGRSFPADFVVVSCGNRGNIGFLKDAGVTVERAVVVNEYMETNLPDVYACGDCCQLENLNYQLWQEASGQGRIAGANAAGEKLAYSNQIFGLSMEGFGTGLYAIGDAGKQADLSYKIVEIKDDVTGRFEKYWFFGGSLQGAVIIGAQDKVPEITNAVTTHARYQELF